MLMILLADGGNTALSAALLSAIVSAVVSVSVNAYMNRGHNQRLAFGFVQKIIEFAMQYPFLEDQGFCDQWPDIPDKEQKLRYEYYCCHVFNTLEKVYELTKDGLTDAKSIVYPDELIFHHRKWWTSELVNIQAYSSEFQQFVNHIIAKSEGANQ